MRALLPGGEDAVAAGRKVLTGLDLIRISTGVLDDAAMLLPADLGCWTLSISPLPEGWAETSGQ
jgi:hypothetical protein